MTFRKLPGLETPEQSTPHDKTELHDFVKRAFTWEERPEEKDVIETIEKTVEDFFSEHFEEADRIVEIFNVTESMDVSKEDRLLLELQTEIARIEGAVTKHYLRAQYSYYMFDDKYWNEYRKPVSGTVNDLTSYAVTKTREDRYFYFVQYAAWKQISDKLQGIKSIARQIQSRQYHR